ncbi:MAG: leucine-rich repeat protein [Bacteroidota bacterium]|jgi:Leucine-rich repeat (LRR) protein
MKYFSRFALIIALILSVSNRVSAQYVTIPDPNFRAFLQQISNLSACFNAQGKLDTTCTALLNVTSLSCDNQNIASIEGIKYFKNLETLYCTNNVLTSMPKLPNSLTYLDCQQNQILSFYAFPTVLNQLNCSGNPLNCLPTLPNSLHFLRTTNTAITCIPNRPS